MIKTIGEIGINHNGDIDIAKKIINLAHVAGFDYVKFQKRDIDLAVPEHKKNEPKSTPWGDMTYYDYKQRVEFDYDDYAEIDKYCKNIGIRWFSSVWDINSAKFMTQFSNIVKIPSACIGNLEMLKFCRKNYKTVIMSTGMSVEKEIEKAVYVCDPDVIMHTNSAYPSPIGDLNFHYIKWLQDKYDCEIGYSGHEYGLTTSFAVAATGITWLERHITLDKNMWGTDQSSSLDKIGCVKLIAGIRSIEKTLKGYGPREILESEKKKRKDLKK